MGQRAPLVITAGEPAGIGPELCLSLARESLPAPVVIVSDPGLLRERAREAGIDVEINEIDLAAAGDVEVGDDA